MYFTNTIAAFWVNNFFATMIRMVHFLEILYPQHNYPIAWVGDLSRGYGGKLMFLGSIPRT